METIAIKQEFETNGNESLKTIDFVNSEANDLHSSQPSASNRTEFGTICKVEPGTSNAGGSEAYAEPTANDLYCSQPSTSSMTELKTVYNVEQGTSNAGGSEAASQAQTSTSRNKRRRANRKRIKWDDLNMIKAIKNVREGAMRYRKAAKLFNVPRNMLKNFVEKRDIDPSIVIDMPLVKKRAPIEGSDKLTNEEESSSNHQVEQHKIVKRKAWDKQNMIHAVQAVREGAMGYLAASRMFKVPKITLRRYVKKETIEPSVLVNAPLGRKPNTPEDVKDYSSEGRVTWTKENMIKAVLCIRSGRLRYAEARKLFKVPYLTLRWYVKNAKIDLSTEKDIPLESMAELTEIMKSKRKPAKRKLWDKQKMINAINAVRDGAVGYLAASKMFDVPKVTLRRYVKQENFDPSELIVKSLGRKPAMPQDLQDKLVEYSTEMDERFFGLKGVDVLRMANQLAKQNNINTFQKDSAGRTWLHNFVKKYPALRFRTNRNSYDKSTKLSRENVSKFLDMYEPMYEKVGRQSRRIFSVDDIALCFIEDEPEKVIRLRGMKDYLTLSAEEKNKLITAIVCMNATGSFIPPLIVWPSKYIKNNATKQSPPGSIWACHSSGWVTAHIFMMWFDHFIKLTCPSPSNPVLLLLDGRKMYIRNIEILDKAKENNVLIVSLPPNSAQLLQPLEVSFINSFKGHYTFEMESFLDLVSDEYKLQNPNFLKPVRIAKIFTAAYTKAETEQAEEKAFEKMGLCPLMASVFLSSNNPSSSCTVLKIDPETEFQVESPITNT